MSFDEYTRLHAYHHSDGREFPRYSHKAICLLTFAIPIPGPRQPLISCPSILFSFFPKFSYV